MRKKSVIAERSLVLVRRSDRTRIPITLRIGRPYWIKEKVEAACPIAVDGYFGNLKDIHGSDRLQALELSTGFMNLLLSGFSERHDIYWPDGERYSSDDVMYLYGRLKDARDSETRLPEYRTRPKRKSERRPKR